MIQSIRTHLPWLLTASMIVACGDDNPADGGDETAGSETAETAGTEDEIGDDASTTSTTTTDDGETETTTSTTTTDDGCSVGSEGCECTQGGGCDPGLECLGGICTPLPPDTTGPDTGPDTSTDTTTDTGNTACDMDVSFEILAVDATDADGWDPFMSMLGEGMIMAWDQQTPDAFITWDIDVPCDDTWHVWVRGIDQGQADSYLATVDGEPNPEAIFELDCTQGPNQGTYVWKELNWRDQADPGCTYLQDPWTQDWMLGIHQFTLLYRESGAVSRLWITNTDQPPP